MSVERSGSKEDTQSSIPVVRADGLVLVLNTPKGEHLQNFLLQSPGCLSQNVLNNLGRGLYACKDIPAHTVIDIAPVLVLDPVENEHHVKKTQLYNYT